MYYVIKSKAYQQIRRFPKLLRFLPLKINKLGSRYSVVSVGKLEFVILRDFLEMREFLVNEDFAEHRFVLQHSSPLRLLDLGCHIGTWSIYFASKGIEVIGVDANSDVLRCLRASLQLNNSSGKILNKIVSPAGTKVIFRPGSNSLTGSATRVTSTEYGDKPIDLPTLIARFSPDFVKLDLEGLDIDCVLEVPRHLLLQLNYLVIELNSNDTKITKLISHLRAADLYPIGFFDLKRKFYSYANFLHLNSMGNLHFKQEVNKSSLYTNKGRASKR